LYQLNCYQGRLALSIVMFKQLLLIEGEFQKSILKQLEGKLRKGIEESKV
jgi:hypothetical protein